MHGLPDQSLDDALYDLQQAIDCAPPHLSWYQLTIEPNTAFASKPPTLPEDDTLWDIYEQGHAMLTARGYQQYDLGLCQSGLSVPPQPQLLALWRLSGDRLRRPRQGDAILPTSRSCRTAKVKHPKGYLDPSRPYLDERSGR